MPLVGLEQENHPPSKTIPLSFLLQNKTTKINKVGSDGYYHFCEVTTTIKREKHARAHTHSIHFFSDHFLGKYYFLHRISKFSRENTILVLARSLKFPKFLPHISLSPHTLFLSPPPTLLLLLLLLFFLSKVFFFSR